jgi:antitoxin component of MazEF toxin-antitoxin module
MFVKARHQGNSIVLTIPKSINVKANTEYSVMQGEDGNCIILCVRMNSSLN